MNGIILAAGLGTRLLPLTNDCPKAMVEVAGKSLLEHLIVKMRNSGFKHIVVNVHHFAYRIIDFLKENNNFGLRIDISDERELLLDTGGGIAKALSLFSDDNPVLIHNVDIVTDLQLGEFYQFFTNENDIVLFVQDRDTSRKLYFDEKMRLKGWMNSINGDKKTVYDDFSPSHCSAFAFSGIHIIGNCAKKEFLSQKDGFSLIPFYLSMAKNMDICANVLPKNTKWVDAGRVESLPIAASILTNCE